MNKRRSSRGSRCTRCKIHQTLCFCDQLSNIQTRSRISIIMHHRETYLTSNTANLAKLVLPNSQIFLRGLPDRPFCIKDLNFNPNELPLYLFPHEDAIELNSNFMEEHGEKNFHLIIPDGTWSQAVKFYRREPGLGQVQCVKLPKASPGRYRLRKSSDENRLSTYEAIARALGILEKDLNIQEELEKMFDTMVERVIRGRSAFEN